MTNQKLKQDLKQIYQLEETEKEKKFVKIYEKRKKRLAEVILHEFRYMGLGSLAAGVCLVGLFYLIASSGNSNVMWYMSGIFPVGVLFPISMINRSERYGMWELELSSRFSLETLRLAKLFILGVFSFIVLTVASVLLGSLFTVNFGDALLYIAIPYMSNVSAGLLICRKWHSRESIYGCVGMTIVTCLMPYAYEQFAVLQQISKAGYYVCLVMLILFSARQAKLYVKESENILWNFS